jgi:hypothetical protein
LQERRGTYALGYQKVSENGIVRNSEGAASAALSISVTIFPAP